jgi:hypothetical protein
MVLLDIAMPLLNGLDAALDRRKHLDRRQAEVLQMLADTPDQAPHGSISQNSNHGRVADYHQLGTCAVCVKSVG